MSSINFNAAATQALRTLQASNTELDATQGRISSGLKIGEAKDNAAYWSISTTMKSDNKALSTVTDALGLGAATLDTAYQGLSAAKDVLDEIKSKLTSALGSNVDRTAIQAEITSLQDQLKSIASSSTFSGENWLSVNSGLSTYNAEKTVVSSFTRDVAGNVTVGEISYDSSNAVLFDSDTTKTTRGILDSQNGLSAKVNGVETALSFGGKTGTGNGTNVGGLTTTAGVQATGSVAVPTATKAEITSGTAFAFNRGTTPNALDDGSTIAVSFTDDAGSAFTVNLTITTAASFNAAAFKTAFNASADATGKVSVDFDSDGHAVFTSLAAGDGTASKLALTGVVLQDSVPATVTDASIGFTTIAEGTGLDVTTGEAKVTVGAFGGSTAITLDDNDTITFNVTAGTTSSSATKKVTINQAIVNEALSVGGVTVSDGKISNVADYKKVVELALSKAGVTGVNVAVGTSSDSDKLVFTSATPGATQVLTVGGAVASNGGSTISVDSIDVTDDTLNGLGATTAEQRVQAINAYINVVNAAINKVTAAASGIGAVSKRVDLQQTFVQNLMDTIDKGVSGLVDADMNEESTKLQALQVKQQLGVQALSIANQSAQNVLRLFQ
ncbi:flagellin [Aureimonas sp. ME7]|uniref:flagellin N-terminal helical domain-containing protein n=1 Tax=Aureimonas sp. ME7 TaxID=2744252 RepID=UPI0024540AB0|nr:flagellin [Aureimonas sp. ME7]